MGRIIVDTKILPWRKVHVMTGDHDGLDEQIAVSTKVRLKNWVPEFEYGDTPL